jgi:hypothetical protein
VTRDGSGPRTASTLVTDEPYERTPEGEPLLERSAVLFLDVLGAQAESGLSPGEYLVKLDAAAREGQDRAFLRAAATDSGLPAPRTPAYVWFSDNLAAGWPVGAPWDEEMALGGLEVAAAHIQLALANRGLFARGGISLGQHFMDREIVFGPALIEAVDLEKAAAYPRVVLSAEAAASEHYHLVTYYGASQFAPQQSLLLVDADGVAFVNYLELLFEAFDDGEDQLSYATKGFEKHRDAIQHALTRYASIPHIMDKYRWLAAYHDHCVRSAGLDAVLLVSSALTRPPIHEFASYSPLTRPRPNGEDDFKSGRYD